VTPQALRPRLVSNLSGMPDLLARDAQRDLRQERGQEFDSASVSNGEAVAYAAARQLRSAARPKKLASYPQRDLC
jgi:uncharacterized protein YoaH (UPF0181 family)